MLEKKIKIEYLIDTDVLFEHLIKRQIDGDSFLIRLMKKGLCFTTVLNAAELMLKSTDGEQEKSIRSLLSALKVLGIHSRYCLNVNTLSLPETGDYVTYYLW
jgi:predicted nucleic acid-binding protein